MKKIITTVAISLGLAMTLSTGKANAATLLGDYLSDLGVEAEVSASVDYYDKYMWRGFKLDGDSVVQPAVTISAAGLEGGFWGSWDVESNDALASDEVDGWIGYSFDLGFVDPALEIIGISFGNTWYGFPEADAYTTETYLGVSVDTILSPYLTWYHDYGDEDQGGADGDYLMLGIGHSVDLVEDYGITLDLGAEIGFNNEAFINGEGGYYLLTSGLTIPLSENVTMSPVLGYSIPFGDLEDSGDGNQDDEVYGGVSLAFAF